MNVIFTFMPINIGRKIVTAFYDVNYLLIIDARARVCVCVCVCVEDLEKFQVSTFFTEDLVNTKSNDFSMFLKTLYIVL